jgi:hypothetical protein
MDTANQLLDPVNTRPTMFDNALEITLFDRTLDLGFLDSPHGIAIAVGVVLILLMTTLAFTIPRLYQLWFVPVLWVAFAVAAAGSAYCWGMSAGIVEAFDKSRDLDAALIIHDMTHQWRLASLWFSLGFLVFCALHVGFGFLARWVWLRRNRKQDASPIASEEPSTAEQ